MKERCSKKRIHVIDNVTEASTLDDIHINTIKKFKEKNENINNLVNDIEKLKILNIDINDKLSNDNLNINSNEKKKLWYSNVLVKEDILNKTIELNELNESNEIDYYEKTGKILFNYYDILDKNVHTNNISVNKNKKFTILDALNIDIGNKVDSSVNNKTKTSLVNEYLSITENKYINHLDGEFISELCSNCNKGNMINLQHEAISICIECGYQDFLLAEQNRPIMINDKKDNIHYSYKRINHFREWCNQVQGKESTDIPNEVFDKILNELKKEKITDTKTLTPKHMRSILKKLRTHKYYEHAAYIINRINGVPPPQFSPELEQTLSNMFMQTQPLFIKHAPSNRLNFISYSYILHKFFLILDLPEYLPLFPLLKSRQKIAQNEETFKKICNELKWKWIPSI
tara:strand:+ start:3998 stop:5203 length:1206 start_codon:yes stop_codon:yes gene_type:complete